MKITDISGTTILHNGVEMPYIGLGVFKSKNGKEVVDAVNWAVDAGYRHIDTASFYQNEEGVGKGVRQCGIPRENIFVVSKVWNADQGYDKTLRAFEVSMDKLGLDYLDLYLVHWPVPGKYLETWEALEFLYAEGRVKSIGVSNFLIHHLEDVIKHGNITPMVNQVEFHPYLVQKELLDFCKNNQIQYEAWSPIMKGRVREIPLLRQLARKYGKAEIQITLRWDLQKGVVTIPKSTRKDRIISNADIFDFEITPEDIQKIDQLDKHERIGPHPDHADF